MVGSVEVEAEKTRKYHWLRRGSVEEETDWKYKKEKHK
jgi:hypothetical protein